MAISIANGLIDDSLLVPAEGTVGARLRPGAAAAWSALRAETLRQAGWTPQITSSVDAYRPLSMQESIFQERYVEQALGGGYYGDVRWWQGRRYVRRKGFAAAAVPGTSNHGYGKAVDIATLGSNPTRFAQIAAIAPALGWSHVEGASVGEAWHWVFTGDLGLVSKPVASVPTVTTPKVPTAPKAPAPLAPQEDDDMKPYLFQTDPRVDGNWYLVDHLAGTARKITNGFHLALIRDQVATGDVLELTGPQPMTALDGLNAPAAALLESLLVELRTKS